MRNRTSPPWLRRIRALQPKGGSLAEAVLDDVRTYGLFILMIGDNIFCRLAQPDRRPTKR